MASLFERIRSGWNAFRNNKDQTYYSSDLGSGTSFRPDRSRYYGGTDRSMVTALYNRIAIDVASITFQHVRVDGTGMFIEVIDSDLNKCLNWEANTDQSGRELLQDIAHSMCDEGCVAVVPVDTDIDPLDTSSYKILSLRVGKIVEWFPQHVRVSLYDERYGKRDEIKLPKSMVAIIENPLYATMNGPNSNLQRIIRKLNLLDAIDEQSGSGKLDLIIQLPYTVRSEARQNQANKRRKAIEMQLTESKYGIAYIDSTEKITQLNRSLENNLLKQIEYLMNMLYGQMGISEAVFNGTAEEQEMLTYHSRTIEPFCGAICNGMKRKWISKTARTQGQSIMYFRDPFKLVPTSQIAEMSDKFTRNEIMSTNEIRAVLGMKPAKDPRADELRNKNINQEADAPEPVSVADSDSEERYK